MAEFIKTALFKKESTSYCDKQRFIIYYIYGKIYNNCWNNLIHDHAEFLGPYSKHITNNTCVHFNK